MNRRNLPIPRPPARQEVTLERYLEQPFPTADRILLCSFGPDLTGKRAHKELSIALHRAGFPSPLARHLIRVSPLLHRAPKRCYYLRKTED